MRGRQEEEKEKARREERDSFQRNTLPGCPSDKQPPQQLIDTESPLPPPPPLLSGEGFGLLGGPHNATASVLDHRMMAFTDQQRPSSTGAQHGNLPDAQLEQAIQEQHAQAPGALPPPGTGLQGGRRHQDYGLQTFPHLPSSALQARADWFLLDASASNPSPPFLQPIDPFLTHPGTNIVDFGLGIPGEDFATHTRSSITPLPPLSGTSSNFDFDFDFNSPIWEPPIGDGVTLSPGIDPTPHPGAGIPHSTEAYRNIPDPSTTTAASEQRQRGPSWLNDDDLASPRDLHSSQSSRGATTTARRRQKKGKPRDDSTTASGSARSPSTRTKTRAKSVATTTSASSSSTAPTPSSLSATSVAGPSTAPPPASSTAATPKSSSTMAMNQSRLRSASRASKNSVNRPSDTPEERRTRASHNLVEKQYRSRLNAQFEGLLNSLPDTAGRASDSKEGETTETASPKGDLGLGEGEADQSERKVSKAEVLERARLHIEMLERESETLRREREELIANLLRAESEMVSSGGEGLEEFLRRTGQGQGQGQDEEQDEEEEKNLGVKRE